MFLLSYNSHHCIKCFVCPVFSGINSGLISFFFGPDSEGFLTVDKFLEFQRHLQNEILALEFKRKISDEKDSEELISEKGFAELLITYAGFHPKKKTKMLKRVKREFGKDLSGENAKGITLEEYQNFYQVTSDKI